MIRLLAGDCRDVLATLPAESVQCVVTSPPYYGLRDYGTALWDGGDADCGHSRPSTKVGNATTLRLDGREHLGLYDGEKATEPGYPFRDVCGKCGAVRVDRQIGLEASPSEYLATMVGVFREVRRVLRRDGTCWVNMGDSYNGTKAGNTNGGTSSGLRSDGRDEASRLRSNAIQAANGATMQFRKETAPDLAAKQLLLMPARLALALQADGWWVRSDIIWHKPNPMPESCRDRCVSAHEHVFMLTKSARYFFDAAAIREPTIPDPRDRLWGGSSPTVFTDHSNDTTQGMMQKRPNGFVRMSNPAGRSCRNVWTIATHAYSEAHFATFPPELAERCIKAGTSERGACSQCGAPWVRVTKETEQYLATKAALKATKVWNRAGVEAIKGPGTGTNPATLPPKSVTIGWRPFCSCCRVCDEQMLSCNPGKGHEPAPYPVVPCTVLDPFIGAGTTALVADRLQRDCIGIDLNTQYTRMAMERCRADAPLFTSFAPAEDPEDERMGDLFAGDEYERRPSAVSERKPFRTGATYVHQGPQPSNGVTDMAAD